MARRIGLSQNNRHLVIDMLEGEMPEDDVSVLFGVHCKTIWKLV